MEGCTKSEEAHRRRNHLELPRGRLVTRMFGALGVFEVLEKTAISAAIE